MKTLLLALGISAGLTASCVAKESEANVDPLAALKQADQERIQAQIHSDAAELDRLYADDFIGIGPTGNVRNKTQVIADFTGGSLKYQSIVTADVTWRVYGDTAVETGRSTMVGNDRGKVVPNENRFTRVWVRQHGHWQLVQNHYSLLVTQH